MRQDGPEAGPNSKSRMRGTNDPTRNAIRGLLHTKPCVSSVSCALVLGCLLVRFGLVNMCLVFAL